MTGTATRPTRYSTHDPYTGQVLQSYAIAPDDGIRAAIAESRAAHSEWRTRPTNERFAVRYRWPWGQQLNSKGKGAEA